MRAAIYGRVSTHHGQDVGLQVDDLQSLARHRGWSVVDTYIDEGVSGAQDTRPGLDRMLADAQAGRLDVVAVWKLDRLGRSCRRAWATGRKPRSAVTPRTVVGRI